MTHHFNLFRSHGNLEYFSALPRSYLIQLQIQMCEAFHWMKYFHTYKVIELTGFFTPPCLRLPRRKGEKFVWNPFNEQSEAQAVQIATWTFTSNLVTDKKKIRNLDGEINNFERETWSDAYGTEEVSRVAKNKFYCQASNRVSLIWWNSRGNEIPKPAWNIWWSLEIKTADVCHDATDNWDNSLQSWKPSAGYRIRLTKYLTRH